jgi:magnesium transporter
VIVDCAAYRGGVRIAGTLLVSDALEAATGTDDSFAWIGMHEPTENEFAEVAAEFGLHPLAIEDAVHAHQRPKLEHYGDNQFGDTDFVVFKSARYADREEIVEIGEVMAFVGQRFIATVRHGIACELTTLRSDLEAHPADLARGPLGVLYAIADRIVDDYEAVVLALENDIDEIQEAVFAGAKPTHAERIFRLRREVLQFRQAVGPLLEPLRLLSQRSGDLDAYFRDVHDHASRVGDRLGTFDSLLSDALAANVAQVGVRQNEDMRKISAWVAIVAVPTLMAGIFGMNFEHMPELQWRFGYPLALGAMAASSLLLYRNFRRRNWL